MTEHASEVEGKLMEQIPSDPMLHIWEKVRACMQCGTCTGSCVNSLCHGHHSQNTLAAGSVRFKGRNPQQQSFLALFQLLLLHAPLSERASPHGGHG